jgi:hypothetical protein
MATYLELSAAKDDANLRARVAFACVVAAETIRVEDPATASHAERLKWAKTVYISPESVCSSMLWSVLAQNKAVTIAQINAATDASLQTAVDAAIAAFL